MVDECVKRGEVTVEKGRALNEELKHKRAESAPADSEKSDINVEELSADQRAKLLEKLLSMQEEKMKSQLTKEELEKTSSQMDDKEWEEWLEDISKYEINKIPCDSYEYLVRKEKISISPKPSA